jgi:hypothetical protein
VLSAGALLKNLICASREANTALQAKPLKVRTRRNIDIADLNTHNLRRGEGYG